MKVQCVKNKKTILFIDPVNNKKILYQSDEYTYDLIIGKWYDSILERQDFMSHFYIINNNIGQWYPADLFITVKKSRKDKLKQLYEII
jgi:hypothetical protein